MKSNNNTKEEHTYNFYGKNILIVDDDKLSTYILNKSLGATGAEVLSAENGMDAIKLVKDRHIDLILMDISMPVMDGYTATKEIRKSNKNVTIIMHTALEKNLDNGKYLEVKANDYLTKPVSRDILLSTIEKHL